MLIPIDTIVIDNEEIDERLELIMEESYVLSNRLNQLRAKIRKTDRDKLEIEAISKQIDRLRKELDELDPNKQK